MRYQTRTILIALAVPVLLAAPFEAPAQGDDIGGHADLCVVGEFYRGARYRRVTKLLITDSNGINADGLGTYGYVSGLHEAAFEDQGFGCWAVGMYSGAFAPSANPVFSVRASTPVSIGDPVVSGFAADYRGYGSVNGSYLSVRNGLMAEAGSFAGLRSVTGASAPDWFRWNEIPLTIHYTTFRDTAPGSGKMQLQLEEAEIPVVLGPTIVTNGAAEDTVVDARIEAAARSLPRHFSARLELRTRSVFGQSVWNYIIPEIPNRRAGFHIAQLWVEGGGRAVDAAQDLAGASTVHLNKFFERLSTVQDEQEPWLVVEIVLGGNDATTGGNANAVVSSIDTIRTICETAWLNAGNSPEGLVFLIVGYHPRTEGTDFGFRTALRDYAVAMPRVAFYDPAAEFTIQDMIDEGYSDNPVTGNDPHMTDHGYRVFAQRQLEVIESARANGKADLNGDGLVNTADLGIIIRSFGAPYDLADLNADGVVNAPDLGELLAEYGKDPCPDGT